MFSETTDSQHLKVETTIGKVRDCVIEIFTQ